MAQPQKETILGNYTSFPRFPLDCESMDYIQENIKHLAIVAQIAGCDKLIIKGCTGSPRTEGYVYVRTGDDLVGEILYYGGGTGVRCSIATDNIDTTANGETFANAYTKRKLVSGTTGTWAWSEFQPLSEITNAALKAAVDGKAASNHNHDTAYAAKNHNHDNRYYTETEINTILNGKADSNHNHDTAYAAKNHNHDDRYYTESEIDAKLAVGTDDHQSHIFIRKYGRVVTISFIGISVSNNKYYQWTGCIPYDYRPAVNYNGVGFGYLGSEMDDYPPSSNMIAFRIDTNGTLTIGKNTTSTNFEGSATYISAR